MVRLQQWQLTKVICAEAAMKNEIKEYKVIFQGTELSSIPEFITKDEDSNAFIYQIVIDDELKTILIVKK